MPPPLPMSIAIKCFQIVVYIYHLYISLKISFMDKKSGLSKSRVVDKKNIGITITVT